MFRVLSLALIVLLPTSPNLHGEDPVFSGPQVGEQTPFTQRQLFQPNVPSTTSKQRLDEGEVGERTGKTHVTISEFERKRVREADQNLAGGRQSPIHL